MAALTICHDPDEAFLRNITEFGNKYFNLQYIYAYEVNANLNFYIMKNDSFRE
jgi:hypothetical protein